LDKWPEITRLLLEIARRVAYRRCFSFVSVHERATAGCAKPRYLVVVVVVVVVVIVIVVDGPLSGRVIRHSSDDDNEARSWTEPR